MTASGLHHPYWWPLAIAAGLAAVTFWLARLAQAPVSLDMGGFGHDPDYVVERFQATAFDIDGKPRYRLAAERMTHYMDDDTTALAQPRFLREVAGQPTWRVAATRGVVSSNGENVHLLDDVQVERVAAGPSPSLTLTTNYLWVIPEADILRTDRPITLRQGTSQVTAGGMEVEGKQRTLALAGRVKGIYESRH
jgi:lipopolysaccharide export system protein LptC